MEGFEPREPLNTAMHLGTNNNHRIIIWEVCPGKGVFVPDLEASTTLQTGGTRFDRIWANGK